MPSRTPLPLGPQYQSNSERGFEAQYQYDEEDVKSTKQTVKPLRLSRKKKQIREHP